METNTTYNEAVKYASYFELHRRAREGMGDMETAHDAEREIHGMAKIISTIYGTWDDDDYGKAYWDIIAAADAPAVRK